MTLCLDTPLASPAAQVSDPTWIKRLTRSLQVAHVLYKQRKALVRLDDRMLKDLGVTREQANSEAGRPVWDVPNHWKS